MILVGMTGMGNAALTALERAGTSVVAVITDPIAGPGFPHYPCEDLIGACRRRNTPVWSGMDLVDRRSVRRIAGACPDALVVATSRKMVSDELVERLEGRVISAHPSLLPRHRGPTPVPWTIECGDRETGLTYIQPTAMLDAGPIWHQVLTSVPSDETAGGLRYRLDQILLPESLPGVVAGVVSRRLTPTAQAEIGDYEGRYQDLVGDVSWHTDTVEGCLRRFRARTPFPGCFITYRRRGYRVTHLRPVAAASGARAGTMTMHHGARCVLDVADGQLAAQVECADAARTRRGAQRVGCR